MLINVSRLVGTVSGPLIAGLLPRALGSHAASQWQSHRHASSHAENTNKFLREVRAGTCVSGKGRGLQVLTPSQVSALARQLRPGPCTPSPAHAQMLFLYCPWSNSSKGLIRTTCVLHTIQATGMCAVMGPTAPVRARPSTRPPGPPFAPPSHTCPRPLPQALVRLDYPDKLQSLLLTPRREMSVELVVQVWEDQSVRTQSTGSRAPCMASSALRGAIQQPAALALRLLGMWGTRWGRALGKKVKYGRHSDPTWRCCVPARNTV